MGIMDAFKPEDRTEVTYSNFYNLIKQAAQYEIVMNAVNCNVPHRYIRETMTGEKEEEVAEMAQTAEGISMKFYGKEQLPAEPIKSGGNKTNSRNKKAHDRESKEERNEEPWQK